MFEICVQMADELYDLLDRDTVERSRTFLPDSAHSFLDKIVKPIYEILAAVRLEAQCCFCCAFLSIFCQTYSRPASSMVLILQFELSVAV